MQNSGATEFYLGEGTTTTATGAKVPDGGGWYGPTQLYGTGGAPGSEFQCYINSNGHLENRIVVSNVIQFPESALLPLALVRVDEVSRIMELNDYRPA